MDKDIFIKGLTAHQVYLLDTMWEIDDYEDFMEWHATLSPLDKVVAMDLALKIMEQTVEKPEESLEQARQVLKKFML